MNDYKFQHLGSICSDMRRKKKGIEQFYVTYNGIQFDCILSIDTIPFELMIGALRHNFACILSIRNGYLTTMSAEDYYKLCEILNLSYSKEHFTSYKFLQFIDDRVPTTCKEKLVNPKHLIPFRAKSITSAEKAEGFIFCGWQRHKGNNNGHVRNLSKTERFLGKTVADYCEKNDISSKWTDDITKAVPLTFPWDD